MVNKETIFTAVDNSGAKKVKVIGSLKKKLKNVSLGDFVLISVQNLRKKRKMFSKVKKGGVYIGLVIGLKYKQCKIKHSFLKKDVNSVIILSRTKKTIGNRVYKTMPIELRKKPLIRPLSSTIYKLV